LFLGFEERIAVAKLIKTIARFSIKKKKVDL
jgi:hypothetical protein